MSKNSDSKTMKIVPFRARERIEDPDFQGMSFNPDTGRIEPVYTYSEWTVEFYVDNKFPTEE